MVVNERKPTGKRILKKPEVNEKMAFTHKIYCLQLSKISGSVCFVFLMP
jgi:hypothetical protein